MLIWAGWKYPTLGRVLFALLFAWAAVTNGRAAMLTRGRPFRLGLAGAIVFLLSIAPLGVGSAFPATVLMALGAALLLRQVLQSPMPFLTTALRRAWQRDSSTRR